MKIKNVVAWYMYCINELKDIYNNVNYGETLLNFVVIDHCKFSLYNNLYTIPILIKTPGHEIEKISGYSFYTVAGWSRSMLKGPESLFKHYSDVEDELLKKGWEKLYFKLCNFSPTFPPENGDRIIHIMQSLYKWFKEMER